jgi:hypothetical protein
MMPSRQTFALPPDTVPSDWEPHFESWWEPIADDLSIPDFLKRTPDPKVRMEAA